MRDAVHGVLVFHSAKDMQKVLDNLIRTQQKFNSKVNNRKTKCFYQPVENLSAFVTEESIVINDEELIQ